MIKKWMENIQRFKDGKPVGECPFCKSKRVEYKETVVDENSKLGFADIWCEDCKNAFHLSRGYFHNPIKTTDVIPDGLKY